MKASSDSDSTSNPAIELNSIEGVLATVRRTGMAILLPAAAASWASYTDLRVIPLSASGKLSIRSVGLLWKRVDTDQPPLGLLDRDQGLHVSVR